MKGTTRMSVETGTNEAGTGEDGGTPRTFTQEQMSAAIEKRLKAERDKVGDLTELKRKASEFDKLDAASKTEIERANARIKELEASNAELSTAQLKAAAGAAHGLSAAQAKRLVGSTAEELEADAKALAAELGITKGTPGGDGRPTPGMRPVGGDGSGNNNQGSAGANEWMRARMGRNN
jgi:hypothetical protein